MKKLFLMLTLAVFAFANPSFAQKITAKKAVAFTKTKALSTMKPIPPQSRDQAWKIMSKMIPNPSLDRQSNSVKTFDVDPALQSTMGIKKLNPKDISSFEGVNNVSGVAPPDNMGDVGPSNYLEMINLSFAIYNKNGRLLYGPADNSTLWANLPGPWSGSNDGDPIVNYDEMAGRWVVSQFALPNFPDGPFYELVAVSATDDPQGSWYLYAFQMDDMPDYPKFGVWPDAYYMSVNSFSASSLNFMGAGVAAMQRDSMLVGSPNAQMIFYQQSSSVYSLLPADLDGTNTPPDGTPGIFAELDGSSNLLLYRFIVDWDTPSNSMFVGPSTIPVDPYADVCSSRDCVPQAGTSDALDALSGRLMYRLQYRYFGAGDERMVTNHTVDKGNGTAAIRWYELRSDGSTWSLYQQGTYSPDDTYRWMGSIAMDVSGNIALGYSASSSSITPEIRVTGRYANDPLGQMTIQEETVYQSPAAQTSVNRWGDYTNMTVDPTDGTTFWYVNEYSNGSWDWSTRVAHFVFEIDTVPPAAITDLAVTGAFSNNVILTWTATGDDGTDGTASSYDIRYSTSPITDANWDDATPYPNNIIPQPSGSTEVDTLSGLDFATTYYFAIKAYDNLANPSPISNSPSGTTDGPPSVTVTPTSLSASLFTGGADTTSFTVSNAPDAESALEYLVEIQYPGEQVWPKSLTPRQEAKMKNDINTVGNGKYQTLYALSSKDEVVLEEHFEDGVPPADWADVDNAGTGISWKTNTEYGEGNYTGGTGEAACVSSDAVAGPFNAELWTPQINVMGRQDLYLSYNANFQALGSDDFLDLDASYDGGVTWNTIMSWNEDHGDLHGAGEAVSILLDDVLPSGTSNIILRWHYYTTASSPWQWYAEIDDVVLSGGSAWLTVNPLNGEVAPGDSAPENVIFSASGLMGGTYTANVVVTSNDPANPAVPVACTLDVTGVQNITVHPDSIQYGTLFVNQTDSAVVNITNDGTDTLHVTSLTTDNTDYTVSDPSFDLAAGETKDVMVYFTPSATGTDNGTLTINSDDPDEPVIMVYMFGFGSDSPVVDVQPLTLSADLLTGQIKDTTFTVSNISTATSVLEYMVSIEYPGEQVWPRALTPRQIEKARKDKNVVGNGKYRTLYALSSKDEMILEEHFEDGVPPTNWTNVDNANSGIDWKTNTAYGEGNYTGGEGEAACVSSDAVAGPFDTELWTPEISVMGRQDLYLSYNANFQALGSSDYLDLDLSTDGGATWSNVMQWNEDHGDLHGAGEAVSILLDDVIPTGTTNIILRWHYYTTASSPWQWYAEIDDVTISGGSAWLAVNPLDGTLENGESQTHNVTFNAAGMFGGTYNANIVVSNNDPLNPNPAVACTFNVTGVQDISVTPDTVDYGTVFVNGTDSAVVNIANMGTDDLAISSVTTDNTVFTVNNINTTLSPGASIDAVVYYSPTAAQSDAGTLTIVSDDPDEGTYTVALFGNAVNPPVIGVTPTSLSADLVTGQSDTQQFTISNTGEADLVYSIDIEQTTAPLHPRITKVHLKKSDGNFPRGKAATSFMPAPKHNGTAHKPNSIKDDDLGYAADVATSYYQTIDMNNPATTTDLFSVTNLFAGAISHSEPNTAYGIDYDSGHLYKLDIENNTATDLGAVSGLPSGAVATGMAFTDDVCYVVAYGSASVLYTLDVTTATVTEIGTIEDGIIIALAANDAGELFAEDISTDVLYGVDPATGAGTEIGSLGFDANYAQGMGFDHNTGVLYMAAYNNGSGAPELRVVDTATGNTALVGTLGDGSGEYDMLSFFGAGTGNWLVVNPMEGTIPSGSSVTVDVTFDANGMVGGDYGANILVNSNDPVTPTSIVTASMHVTGAPNIEVVPEALDYGTVYSGYPMDKTLVISNTGTDDLTVSDITSSNTDFYATVTLPVTITSGNAIEVPVTVLSTTVGDISGDLTITSNSSVNGTLVVPMSATVALPPVVGVSPSSLDEALNVGETSVKTLTISNTGGSDLDFDISYDILKKSTATVNITLPAANAVSNPAAKKNITNAVEERNVTVNKGLENPNSAVQLLILSPDDDEHISDLISTMSSFDDIAMTHFPVDGLGTITLDDLLPYSVVMVQNDFKWSSAGTDATTIGNLLADYVDAGGKVIVNMYTYSYDDWGMSGRFITEGYGPFVGTTQDIWGEGTLGTVYDPLNPIMTGVNAINDSWGHQDPSLASNAVLLADWNDGQPMIAYNDNVIGFNLIGITGNTAFTSDLGTLFHNAVLYLGGTAWLSVDPAQGTVATGTSSDVAIGFDATSLEPGDYTAVLHVATNDPLTPVTDIPVHLGVLTDVNDGINTIPAKYDLAQNYPNPFNPSTIISYSLPVSAKVTIKVFDLLGREVTTLVNQEMNAGNHRIKFDASRLTSGIYFYAIRAEGSNGSTFMNAKKLILMK